MKQILCDIFNKLYKFIVEVSTNENLRNTYIVKANPLDKSRAFSRNRIWNFELLARAVMFSSKVTLDAGLVEFFTSTRMPPTSKEAFIKRRALVSPKFFRDTGHYLVSTARGSRLLKTWIGDKFLANIDGTRISLPYTKELYSKYRQRDDKGHNLARMTVITDSLNKIIISAGMVPNNTEERKAALSLLRDEPFPYPLDKTIFTMDRGYPSLYLMNWFHENTAGFIIRSRRDSNPQISQFMDSDEMEKIITIELSKNRRDIEYERPEPLKVRVVKLPPRPGQIEPVVIMTDLMDAGAYPTECIYDAYNKRWSVETIIGMEKNELQIELFSGNRECCILQDFYAAIIMFNMGMLTKIVADQKIADSNSRKKLKHGYQTDLNAEWVLIRELLLVLNRPRSKIAGFLTLIVNYCVRHTSVIRPGRHQPHIKRCIKTDGKYITIQNYKRPF
ncbi:IS4 family transposase [uncultured Duncaniella sp.]|uniref:IS4 family transposase n=2 Tax=Muribaculaceae TaxID=2005473 RepID=UPI0025AE4043|nr:IS4 family transposase [uncultured Duncaniella sp.]